MEAMAIRATSALTIMMAQSDESLRLDPLQHDILVRQLDSFLAAAPDAQARANIAYKDYREWSEARGEQPLTLTAFGNRLTERGIEKTKGRIVTYHGIGLCDTSATLATHSQVISYKRASV